MEPEVKSKEELFKEFPDRFIDSNNLIIALMRTPDGLSMLCNPRSRSEAVMAKGECELALIKKILSIDVQKENTQVIKPKGGIISAARNRLFK